MSELTALSTEELRTELLRRGELHSKEEIRCKFDNMINKYYGTVSNFINNDPFYRADGDYYLKWSIVDRESSDEFYDLYRVVHLTEFNTYIKFTGTYNSYRGDRWLDEWEFVTPVTITITKWETK